MTDLTGQTIGNYYIEEMLGQGGMGAVYRARDVQLQRLVAFKIMHPEIAAHEDLRKRFLQEARAIAALDHPNIIQIYSFFAADDLYLVMEFVQGGSLRDYLRSLQNNDKFMDIAEAVTLIKQLASALNYAHDQGMIHRDVKPDNVLLKQGSFADHMRFRALLTDFGLAKLAENAVVQTMGHNPMGTLPYMPPEQIKGGVMDGRTDLYALGIMMYEILVGRLPFMPRNIPEAARMHGSEPPPRPSEQRAGITPELEEIILKTLAKDPGDRFQTGNELIQALEDMESKADSNDPEEYLATYIDPSALESSKEESLGTYLASMPGVPHVDVDVPASPANLQNDRIAVLREGYSAVYIPITTQELMIGRDPAHDVTLDSDKVSRNHARINRQSDGSYTIVDLGSTNGTYLEGAKLLSNVSEEWPADQTVTIGDFRLAIQQAISTDTVANVQGVQSMADVRPVGGIAPRNIVQTQAGEIGSTGIDTTSVDLALVPTNITADPGSQIPLQVQIYNKSDIVEHYAVTVQGIPTEWFRVPPQTVQLLPGNSGSAQIFMNPPRDVRSTAGTHPFSVRVASQERATEVGRANGTLTITPFRQFAVDMEPKRIRKRGMLKFLIHNQGNAPDSYTIFGRDREESLQFFPPSASGSVSGGLTEAVEFEVRPKRGNLFGTANTYPFEMRAESSGGMSHVQAGELVHPALLPIWMLMLMLLLCLACAAMLFLLFFNQDEPTPTDTTYITQTNADIRDLLTATAEDYEALLEARVVTSTYIATLDEDNDDLSNADERVAGTDPNNADTDNDGLEDGEEVNKYESDPLEEDTDGDGLKDGDDVDEGGSPTEEDTDGDGLLDGEEVLTYNTSPDEVDSDGDGLRDGVEVRELNTDPSRFDTDGDGVSDALDKSPLDAGAQ